MVLDLNDEDVVGVACGAPYTLNRAVAMLTWILFELDGNEIVGNMDTENLFRFVSAATLEIDRISIELLQKTWRR